MIPIKLSIQGLYSYQELQEIDFQPLIGSNVFGIFGKVGSGKTSLLEAISFALYGKTERLNAKDNQAYNMMNLKSKHLIIDFEFQAGADQQLYKFVYEAKRHPKKHQEISSSERRMFIREDNDWKPIGNEKQDVSVLSKQILGLDYENFKRTIIIPQNQFREFLELSPADRTKMMNQLFKLDQYDLAKRTDKLSKANENDLAELRGLLSPLESVTPEVIAQAKDDVATLLITIDEKTAQLELLEPNEQRLLQLKKQFATLAANRQELADWLTHEAKHQKIQQTIDQYDQCRLLFQPDLLALDKLHVKRRGLIDTEEKARRLLKTATDKLPHLQATYEATRLIYDNREQLNEQIDELDTVQRIRTLQNAVEQQSTNQRQLDLLVEKQQEQIDRLRAEWKKQQTFIDNRFGQESNLERLYKVQEWFVVHKPLQKQADDLQVQVDKYDKHIEEIKQRKNEALIDFQPEWAELTLKTLPDQIDKAIIRLREIEQERSASHQEIVVKAELVRYANNLTAGIPCPLCGSVHHPAKHDNNAEEPDVVKSEQSVAKVRQRIAEMTSLRLTINGLETELRGAIANGKRLIEERSEIVLQLTTHDDMFVWPEFTKDQSDVVAKAIREEGSQQRQLQEAQKAVRDLVEQVTEAERIRTEQTNKVAEAKTALAGLNGQIQVSVESLDHYQLADVAHWGLDKIADLRGSLNQQYTHAKTAFNDAEKERNDAEKELVAAEGQVNELTKQLIAVDEEILLLEHTITGNLIEHGLIREQVEQILQTNLDIPVEKQRIKEYTDKLCGLQNLVSELETELTDQPFDPLELLAVQEQLKAIRGEKDELNKTIGKAGNVLTTLEKQWDSKQKHQTRHDELDLRRQDLKKMDEMFRAQGFVNYVSSVYLKNLCESANERFFKLTNNQLKMELDDKNNFLVRDYLNGGEVRSVKTLSGGQTFQAALSLALALSDNIQHLTKAKQNLFFLDEGFGTLDKDSLQTVFKTLKALRSENRVVGIISHVEELQQEVDTYIRAVASENGSRIVRSWEI